MGALKETAQYEDKVAAQATVEPMKLEENNGFWLIEYTQPWASPLACIFNNPLSHYLKPILTTAFYIYFNKCFFHFSFDVCPMKYLIGSGRGV